MATAVTFVEWHLGLALAGLITLSYLLPPTPPEFKPGQEPADELEEAAERPGA